MDLVGDKKVGQFGGFKNQLAACFASKKQASKFTTRSSPLTTALVCVFLGTYAGCAMVGAGVRKPVHLQKNVSMSAKQQQKADKADTLQWLSEDNPSMGSSLRAAAQAKNWKQFAQIIKKAWVAAGRKEKKCNFLQNSQNCIHIWSVIEEGY